MPLIVLIALTIGGVSVDRLRGVFGSDEIFSATASSAGPLEASHVKQVVYEVYGPGGTAGSISYLNRDAQPKQASFTGLPWSFTVTTTVPAVIASLVAQGDGDEIGCRITVDGVVKDEQSSTGHHAQTSCLVKAA